MKTKAIEFAGCCALSDWCGSHNNTEGRGGVEILLDAHGSLADDDMGEMVCLDCAERLARLLKKRVRQVREKQALGLEFCGDPLRWRKAKAHDAETSLAPGTAS